MKSVLNISVEIFVFQLFLTCSFAQFSFYRSKNYTDWYYTQAERITETCVNLPESGRYYAPPGSIKTSQCIVFFNAVDCIAYDSFLVSEDIPDLVRDLKLQRDIPPRAVSYRACLPSDKRRYVYPMFVFYTSLDSYPGYISGNEDKVKKIPVEPGCSRASVSFNNIMALSPICVKLYKNSYCSDFDYGTMSDSSMTLRPWQPKSTSYFGNVGSLKACNEEDFYKQHKKPANLDTSQIKKDYTDFTYTGGSSYSSGGYSRGSGKLVGRIIFGIIGFICLCGGILAAIFKKNPRTSAPENTGVASEAEVAEAVALNTVTVEDSPPPPYEKMCTNPSEFKKDVVQ